MRDDWKEKKQEWSDKSKYNSFNSYKGLTYFNSHYLPIVVWWNGKTNNLPAPIELSLDSAHSCNFAMQLNYDMDSIKELFYKFQIAEGENFRVFTIMHKYDPKFRV